MVTSQEFNQRIAKDGAWIAVEQLRIARKLNDDQTRRAYHKLFRYVVELMQESRSEVQQIGESVKRLERISQQGSKVWHGSAMSPDYNDLNKELAALLGWTVSLVETVITLQGLIQPSAVPIRISQLASALQALHARRMASGLVLDKGTDLFKSLTELT